FREPRILTRMSTIVRETFNGGQASARGTRSRNLTSTHRFAVLQDGAGAANPDAAAKLGTGQPKGVPQNPEQRRLAIDIHFMLRAVNNKTNHKLRQIVSYCCGNQASMHGRATAGHQGQAEGRTRTEKTSAHAKSAKSFFYDKMPTIEDMICTVTSHTQSVRSNVRY